LNFEKEVALVAGQVLSEDDMDFLESEIVAMKREA
jgi:hypothetical protein